MGENISVTLENLRHEHKMIELSFERQTQMIFLKESQRLQIQTERELRFMNMAPQQQQQQYYPQQQQPMAYYPSQEEDNIPTAYVETPEDKSIKKYGGIKK